MMMMLTAGEIHVIPFPLNLSIFLCVFILHSSETEEQYSINSASEFPPHKGKTEGRGVAHLATNSPLTHTPNPSTVEERPAATATAASRQQLQQQHQRAHTKAGKTLVGFG